MMFPYERVKLLNQLELSIYKYIIAHPVEVEGMTIRQLAKKAMCHRQRFCVFCTKWILTATQSLSMRSNGSKKCKLSNPNSNEMSQ